MTDFYFIVVMNILWLVVTFVLLEKGKGKGSYNKWFVSSLFSCLTGVGLNVVFDSARILNSNDHMIELLAEPFAFLVSMGLLIYFISFANAERKED